MVSHGMAEVLEGGTPQHVANPEVFSTAAQKVLLNRSSIAFKENS